MGVGSRGVWLGFLCVVEANLREFVLGVEINLGEFAFGVGIYLGKLMVVVAVVLHPHPNCRSFVKKRS